MVSERSQSEGDAPQAVSAEDFRKFQSVKDQEIADLRRQHLEERRLNDDLARDIAEARAEMADLRQQGYANADPEMVRLQQEVEKSRREQRNLRRFAEDFAIEARDAKAKSLALEYAPNNPALQKQIHDYVVAAQTREDATARERAVRARLGEQPAAAPPRAPSRDEVDTGRSSGGGARLSWEALRQNKHDSEWRKEHMPRYDKALRDGTEIPDR